MTPPSRQLDLFPEPHKEASGMRREAAGLIRSHLWRGTPPPSPNRWPWHMGRELAVWDLLVSQGIDPEELNGAIQALPSVRPSARRLTAFTERSGGPALLSRCIGTARAYPTSPRRSTGALTPMAELLRSYSPPPNPSTTLESAQ